MVCLDYNSLMYFSHLSGIEFILMCNYKIEKIKAINEHLLLGVSVPSTTFLPKDYLSAIMAIFCTGEFCARLFKKLPNDPSI